MIVLVCKVNTSGSADLPRGGRTVAHARRMSLNERGVWRILEPEEKCNLRVFLSHSCAHSRYIGRLFGGALALPLD